MATRCERELEALAWEKRGLQISPKVFAVYQEQVRCKTLHWIGFQPFFASSETPLRGSCRMLLS